MTKATATTLLLVPSHGSMGNSITICDKIYGVQSGVSVIKKYQLTIGEFSSVNPNLDCEKLFIGQWLCLDGSISS
ncbi:hypothetical protein H5410_038269 [Solanum commersonii]|uniref:LysM domain-containing protein n=1 Tax=Solanum commersonii TaxID=4109 RepID=A0A9J5YA92_SOLCO|nr:hypothetical protein H5410_038269 [Solanum commersonii]